MICCLPACSMDLLVTSTVACIACFYDTVLMLPWIYCILAYVLSYASANCMLAYMLLHRGICTFGALFSLASVRQHVYNSLFIAFCYSQGFPLRLCLPSLESYNTRTIFSIYDCLAFPYFSSMCVKMSRLFLVVTT